MGITSTHLQALNAAINESIPTMLVTVIAVKGSAPRGVGTAMLVQPKGIVGTIGGGRLEYVAIDAARDCARIHRKTPYTERYPLGAKLGQCCGGWVTLLFECVEPNWQLWVNEALNAWQQGLPYQRPVDEHFTHQITPPDAHLVLCGAGHVGRALVSVLTDAPIRIQWVDEREDEFPENVPANTQLEITDIPEYLIESAPAGSAVLITTHRHDLDFKLAESALMRTDLAYVGMIGSASKRLRFAQLLQKRGGNLELLQRLTCPIGIEGVVSKEPSVLAISVAAQILETLKL